MTDDQILRIPISNDGKTMRSVVLAVPKPMTETEWAQFHAVLEAMKPGLVEALSAKSEPF